MESEEKRLQFVSDRIEALVREFGAQHDPAIREKAEELVRLLMELYGAGLNRMLEIVDASDKVETDALFERFASDTLISNLLVLHGLQARYRNCSGSCARPQSRAPARSASSATRPSRMSTRMS